MKKIIISLLVVVQLLTSINHVFAGGEEYVKELWNLLDADTCNGEQIIDFLSAHDHKLKILFDSDADVHEGYTIREHTLRVFEKLNEQFKLYQDHYEFKVSQDIRLFQTLKFVVALHDIGKPLAAKGNHLYPQHTFTIPILKEKLQYFNFTDNEIKLAEALVGHDIVGRAVQGYISIQSAKDQLEQQAKIANMSLINYIPLQLLFYTVDAASYPTIYERYFIETNDGRLIPKNLTFQKLFVAMAKQRLVDIMRCSTPLLPDDVLQLIADYCYGPDTPYHCYSYQWVFSSIYTHLNVYKIDSEQKARAYKIIHFGKKLDPTLETLGEWQKLSTNLYQLKSNQDMPDVKLPDINESVLAAYKKREEELHTIFNAPQKDAPCIEISDLAQILTEADNIVFIVGAGMSSQQVWTLSQFYEKLGLELIPGLPIVTKKSMVSFLENFIKNPYPYYDIISQFYASLHHKGNLSSTKAHHALAGIVELLQRNNKKVVVYSANLDDFERAVKLQVMEESELLDTSKIQSLVIVVLGLSQDHAYIISRYKQAVNQIQIFSFNIKPSNLIIQDTTSGSIQSLVFDGIVMGDLQKTLPTLAKIMGSSPNN